MLTVPYLHKGAKDVQRDKMRCLRCNIARILRAKRRPVLTFPSSKRPVKYEPRGQWGGGGGGLFFSSRPEIREKYVFSPAASSQMDKNK